MTNTPTENWEDHNGQNIQVKILRRYITTEDTCPECGGGLKIAVARTTDDQVYRLECLACAWRSEALPDPET